MGDIGALSCHEDELRKRHSRSENQLDAGFLSVAFFTHLKAGVRVG